MGMGNRRLKDKEEAISLVLMRYCFVELGVVIADMKGRVPWFGNKSFEDIVTELPAVWAWKLGVWGIGALRDKGNQIKLTDYEKPNFIIIIITKENIL